jgi:hypothetical protein
MTGMSAKIPGTTTARPLVLEEPEPDWVGLWFKLAEEINGEYVGMRAGRPFGNEIEWNFLPHYLYDGAGGLIHGLRQESGSDIRLPMPATAPPTPWWFLRAAALLRVVAKKLQPAAPWKSLDRSWRPPAGGVKSAGTMVATHSFDVDQTRRLVEKARAHGVSLNSFLLTAVARTCEPQLGDGPALWMMPVNMRGLVPMKRDTANYLSYLHIDVGRGATAAQVHAAVKQALQKGEHWGIWLFLNVGRLVGYAGMRRLYMLQSKRVDGRFFVGAFSNMGNWDGIGKWFVAPPVTVSCPLGIGTITCDGTLSLTMDAHPSIARDRAWVQTLMDRLVAEIGV